MSILRPCFLIGNGIRNNPALLDAICKLEVPVLTTWQAADLIEENLPVFCGRPGVIGQRAANIILQTCNWLMVVGARLDMETVGHDLDNFASNAEKTVVDVDYAELMKFPATWNKCLLDLDLPEEDTQWRGLPFVSGDADWLEHCKALYARFRPELDGLPGHESNPLDPYSFMSVLSDASVEGDVFVLGSSGTQSCVFLQAFKFKKEQRCLVCNTIGSMGMEPMAIGAAIASGRRVIVVTGDGGFAQNFQELEVVSRLHLPIHYFVFDNGGYGSIATMQDGRFGLRVGSDPESGFTLPHLERIAEIWRMPYYRIRHNGQLRLINEIIAQPVATLTSVRTSFDFRYACKVLSEVKDGVLIPDDLADMTPKLSREEYEGLMK